MLLWLKHAPVVLLSCLLAMVEAAAQPASSCLNWKAGTSTRITLEGGADQFVKLKEAGIAAVELGLARVDTPEAAEAARQFARQAREWADAAGVELWSVHIPFARDLDPSDSSEEQRLKVVSNLARLMEAYSPLRVKKLNIHASYEIAKPIPLPDREARIAAARRSLAELARKADSLGAQLSMECLPRACLGNTSQEVLRLIDGIPTIGVTLDMNHLLQETPVDFIRKVGSRIVNLHVADYDGVDERHWLPGKGINDFAGIVRALQAVGYTGPFLFECAGTAEEKVVVWKKLQQAVARPER